jgi:hypothetical protein
VHDGTPVIRRLTGTASTRSGPTASSVTVALGALTNNHRRHMFRQAFAHMPEHVLAVGARPRYHKSNAMSACSATGATRHCEFPARQGPWGRHVASFGRSMHGYERQANPPFCTDTRSEGLRSRSVVVIQQAADPFATFDCTV